MLRYICFEFVFGKELNSATIIFTKDFYELNGCGRYLVEIYRVQGVTKIASRMFCFEIKYGNMFFVQLFSCCGHSIKQVCSYSRKMETITRKLYTPGQKHIVFTRFDAQRLLTVRVPQKKFSYEGILDRGGC